jgi:hypothetical protein
MALRMAPRATSGVTTLHTGDQITYTCHMDTTAVEATKLGVPGPVNNLTFGNEAFGAEMCVLYVETTGTGFSHGPSQPTGQ